MNEVPSGKNTPISSLNADNLFAHSILRWFAEHGRHDLPWQHPRTPYRAWVAEIMLQQTQVKTVIPYFEKFMQRFPDIQSLAMASQDEVMACWAGLGYYTRARNLHKAARLIQEMHAGEFPQDFESLHALPGIGRSTAGAILAQAFGQRHPILDGNVKRVLTRFHGVEGWPGERQVESFLWQLAEQHTPTEHLADYTQAMMDFGATLCTRSRPDCAACPVHSDCVACQTGRTSQLPGARPRKQLPVKTGRLLVLHNDKGEVLLQKRPPSGIWGGLWSLPECSLDDDVKQHCQQHLRLKVERIKDGPVMRHTFSHYHFDITPCLTYVKDPVHCVMEDSGWLWYNVRQPDSPGLPAPVKTILNRFFNEESP